MNIRLKLVLSAAALAAGCVLLAGCGGSASSASSSASSAASSGAASQSASEPAASVSAEENGASDAVASAVDALLETNPISNQFEIDAISIEYDFFLDADDVVTYKGIKSNDNGDAGLVLAVGVTTREADARTLVVEHSGDVGRTGSRSNTVNH